MGLNDGPIDPASVCMCRCGHLPSCPPCLKGTHRGIAHRLQPLAPPVIPERLKNRKRGWVLPPLSREEARKALQREGLLKS
jgi:hypothetical protein